MAMNKIERLDREIQKTREKITEYQNKLKELTAQSSLCGLCALPRRSLPPCCPATQFPVWWLSPKIATPKNRRTQRMKNKIKRTLTALCAALMLMGGFSVTAFAQTPENDATNDTGCTDAGERRHQRHGRCCGRNRGHAAPYPRRERYPCGRLRRQ